MLVTNQPIEYRAAPYGTITVIPKGTEVSPAVNLPDDDSYWAEPWDGMTDHAEGWFRNYGFLISGDQVELA